MCGFISVINLKQRKNLKKNLFIKKINTHRGPDNIKILHDKNFQFYFEDYQF